ncbi:ParA family protein [Hyphomicrobium sp. CS1BSMeth3]|uniref:ParA family protein n=1 Tax=Hyphomicrobium sp. CS1BSMeth3 TaxID=1892844 RepID=UPI0009307C4F|nr:ParA family protein [Hyphomicrobium sp. CS1BSMeth3]
MECLSGSPEEVAACVRTIQAWIEWAKPFVGLVLSLFGLGALGAVAALLWHLQKYRADTERHERVEGELQAAVKMAFDKQQAAEELEKQARADLTAALAALQAIRGPVDEKLQALERHNSELREKLELLRAPLGKDDADFWARPVAAWPAQFDRKVRESIPVLMFANQKGGVGKTTLATNLAAYFSRAGERVLVVDLDYQGSATALLFAQAGRGGFDASASLVDNLFADSLNDLWASATIKSAAPGLDFVPCWYTFQNVERRLEYRWGMGETGDDVRFRLARAIHSPDVQDNYDRVIIDAPPRFTTGFVNGMCASTHLFVPSVVDRLSAAAVGTFAIQFAKVRGATNPALDFSGIIGTMTAHRKLSPRAASPMERANEAVRAALGSSRDYFMRDATMSRTTKVSYSTDEGIAYLKDSGVREMFAAIGREVARRAPTGRVSYESRANGGVPAQDCAPA